MDDFISEIFALEKPCLIGEGDFVKALSNVLTNWDSEVSLNEALRVWTLIEPDADILDLIMKLKNDYIVCLATNQQKFRANYMSFELGYDELFDFSFYSCQLGKVKPSVEYFKAILNKLNLKSNNLLLLDDDRKNIGSAQEIGIHAEIFNISDKVEGLKNILTKYHIVIT